MLGVDLVSFYSLVGWIMVRLVLSAIMLCCCLVIDIVVIVGELVVVYVVLNAVYYAVGFCLLWGGVVVGCGVELWVTSVLELVSRILILVDLVDELMLVISGISGF